MSCNVLHRIVRSNKNVTFSHSTVDATTLEYCNLVRFGVEVESGVRWFVRCDVDNHEIRLAACLPN